MTIVQYWHSHEVPTEIAALVDTVRKSNPGVDHRVFDQTTAEDHIGRLFTPRELAAFRACGHPAMQADYFRCCALLALGGVYADVDFTCVSSLSSLVEGADRGRLFGWRRVPPALPDDLSERALFGKAKRVGEFRWVENSFFAFPAPGHPFLELAVEMMTAHIESRATESLPATTGPGVFTSLYLLRELGSFEAFVEYARGGVLAPVARISCEAIGDYERIEKAFEGVRISVKNESRRWVRHAAPAYKQTDAYWMRHRQSIFR